MKKILLIVLSILLVLNLPIIISAEDSVVTEPVAEEITTESVTETVPVLKEEPQADGKTKVPSSELAEQFVAYIFSGEEGSDELMDKLLTICEEYSLQKEQGYTFQERMVQLVSSENLVVFSAAAFLVVCGIAFFVIESKRKRDRKATGAYIARLEKSYQKEIKSNTEMKEAYLRQGEEINDMREQLAMLCQTTEANKMDLDKTTRANQAVANMIKDVFLNSKTIDANAKSLLIHNYLEAVNSGSVDAKGEKETVYEGEQQSQV